jgi:hypothetical protein
VAMTMPTTTELSGYVPKAVRESMDFTLYGGRQHRNPSPFLAVGLAAEQLSPQSLSCLEHEYSFAAGLPAWGAKPLALGRHEGRTILVLKVSRGKVLVQNRISGGHR